MVEAHTHDGVDNPQIEFQDIDAVRSKQTALTTEDDATLSTGGGATLSTNDSDVIDNIRTRVGEIETALQNLGLLN